MITVQAYFDEVLADARPELPYPLEQAATRGISLTDNAECRYCLRPLTVRESSPDYDDHDGYDGECRDCPEARR